MLHLVNALALCNDLHDEAQFVARQRSQPLAQPALLLKGHRPVARRRHLTILRLHLWQSVPLGLEAVAGAFVKM